MKTSRDKGFTMIELVIYIVILTAILGVIVAVIVTLSRTENGIKSNLAVADSANSVLDRFTREVRQAVSVNNGNSTFNTSPGTLELAGKDASGNARTVDFYLATTTNSVHFKENGVDQGSLTSGSAKVTNLTFTLSSTSTVAAVRMRLSLESGTGSYYRHEDYYTTVDLRN